MISRRTVAILVIVIISLVVGGLIGFYFYAQNKNPGSVNTPATGGSGKTNFGGYNPDAVSAGDTTISSSTDSLFTNPQTTKEEKIPKLRRISGVPTAGADFVTLPIYEEKPKNIEPEDLSASTTAAARRAQASRNAAPKIIGYKTVIRYMERGTGHIYETASNTLAVSRISNFTEPKIYEAYFVGKGDNLILRNLIGTSDMIDTRYATLITATTTEGEQKKLETKSLPVNINQIAISPSKTKLFSLSNDITRGILSNIDGGSSLGIFDSPYTEWLASWPEEKTILLTTKASGFAPGFAYFLNTQTKELKRILGNIYGLTTLASPNLGTVIYNESAGGVFTLNALNIASGDRYELPIRTMSEKCIWAKTERNAIYCAVPENISFSAYPDVWYQGQIGFADSIWKYNLETGESREVINIQNEFGAAIDAVNLSISSADDYLIFTNKNDLSLWGLQMGSSTTAIQTQ